MKQILGCYSYAATASNSASKNTYSNFSSLSFESSVTCTYIFFYEYKKYR
jgi:hypothetical protein